MTLDMTRLALRLRARRVHAPVAKEPTTTREPILGYADGCPVTWPLPSAQRASGVLVLAASGSGKSVMVGHALSQEIALSGRGVQDGDRPSMFLIEPKGDLGGSMIEAIAADVPARLKDIHYLNPFSDEGGFAFNWTKLPLGRTPIEIRATQLAHLCGAISTAGAQEKIGLGPQQIQAMGLVFLGALCVEHPAASPLLALDAFLLPRGLEMLSAVTSSSQARQILPNLRLSEDLRASIVGRLRSALAASAALERMLCAPSCVELAELTGPGAFTIFDVSRPPGEADFLRIFFANLIGKFVTEFLLERPSPFKGHHTRLVCDEVQMLAPALADRAETLLTIGRSRNLSTVFISQGTTLIQRASSTLMGVLMNNTQVKVIGRLAAPDAELFAREQAPGHGVEETLGAVRSRFVSTTTNLRDREFLLLMPGDRQRFRSAPVDLKRWAAAAEERAEEIAALKRRYVLPRSTAPRLTLADLAPPELRTPRRARSSRACDAPEPADVATQRAAAPVALVQSSSTPVLSDDKYIAERGQANTAQRVPRSRWG